MTKEDKLAAKEQEKAAKEQEKKAAKEQVKAERAERAKRAKRAEININFDDIDAFDHSKQRRSDNDKNNKKREIIICRLWNNEIPNNYYEKSEECEKSKEWLKHKRLIDKFKQYFCNEKNIPILPDTLTSTTCKIKAGRQNHYDHEVTINDIVYSIEFKYNVSKITQCTQIVSLGNPSQYMTLSFEDYFYENGLQEIAEDVEYFKIPDKEIYKKEVHSTKYNKDLQDKYYAGSKTSSKFTGEEKDINRYNMCCRISKECIANFISKDEVQLNKEKLSQCLVTKQKNKIYMMYKKGTIRLEEINSNEFIIDSYEKQPDKSRFIATTTTGRKLEILLRWKNGNGIAYPGFQIKLIN